MLQQFSWQEFLIALGILALVWYVVVLLVFYRKELKGLLSGVVWRPGAESSGLVASGTAPPLPHRWQSGVEQFSGPDPDEEVLNPVADLMGKSRFPEGMSSVSVDQVSFSFPEQDAASREVEDQQGLVPDVLQDIKEVFGVLVKEDGSKRDFFRLMERVRLAYPGLSAHPALRRINAFITDHASFHLSADELEALWN